MAPVLPGLRAGNEAQSAILSSVLRRETRRREVPFLPVSLGREASMRRIELFPLPVFNVDNEARYKGILWEKRGERRRS